MIDTDTPFQVIDADHRNHAFPVAFYDSSALAVFDLVEGLGELLAKLSYGHFTRGSRAAMFTHAVSPLPCYSRTSS